MSAAPDKERIQPGSGQTGRALVPFRPASGYTLAWPSFGQGLLVAAFGLALGVGAAGYHGIKHAVVAWSSPAPVRADPQVALMSRLQDQVGRLQSSVDALRTAAEAGRSEDQLRNLKRSVESLKQNVEQVQSAGAANVAQLAARIDRADHDPSPRLAEIATRLDRIERDAAPRPADGQKVADLAGRVERIEKQVSSPAVTGSIGPAAPRTAVLQAAAVKPPAPKADVTQVPASDPRALPTKPPTLGGWVLRDVYDGLALVEARAGGLREVGPGQYLPGAGEIRSIERRGRGWVVLTSRGVIDNTAF